MSYRGFLAELLLAECDDRARRRSERRITAAKVPARSPYAASTSRPTPSIDPAVVHTLAKCEWVKKGQPLCLIGDSGTDKSHLLIALGTEAAMAAAPGPGRRRAHTRVAWDRRPSAAGGEQDALAQQGDGSGRCGGLQPFSDRGSPTIGSRRVGGGVSLWPSRVLLDQLRRLDQVSSANAWIRLGECLYRITVGLVGHDELAARSLGGV
jgi:hypothetical protein